MWPRSAAGRHRRSPRAALAAACGLRHHVGHARLDGRRRILRELIALASACAAPPYTHRAELAGPEPCAGGGEPGSVVVIGGGLAGLACAYRLMTLGREVMLLEATERAGGRICTLRAPFRAGLFVEAGASHLVPDPALMAHGSARG